MKKGKPTTAKDIIKDLGNAHHNVISTGLDGHRATQQGAEGRLDTEWDETNAGVATVRATMQLVDDSSEYHLDWDLASRTTSRKLAMVKEAVRKGGAKSRFKQVTKVTALTEEETAAR